MAILADIIGIGLAAARPAAPTPPADTLALWYSTDTTELDLWDGSAWVVVAVLPILTLTTAHIAAMDWSTLPTADPGSGKPWLSAGVLKVGP